MLKSFFRKLRGKPEEDDGANRRQSYRVELEGKRVLLFSTYQGRHSITDISAGGMAVKGPFKKGQKVSGSIDPGDGGPHISVEVVIRNKRPGGIWGAVFTRLAERDQERLHRSVQDLTRDSLRQRARARGKNVPDQGEGEDWISAMLDE